MPETRFSTQWCPPHTVAVALKEGTCDRVPTGSCLWEGNYERMVSVVERLWEGASDTGCRWEGACRREVCARAYVRGEGPGKKLPVGGVCKRGCS